MADISKIPTGGVVTLTHSLVVYNSAVNGLLLNLIEFFPEKQRFYNQFPAPIPVIPCYDNTVCNAFNPVI